MTTTQTDRWDRLNNDLAAALLVAGVTVTLVLDRRPYAEVVRGRLESGVSSHIFFKHPEGGTVEVSDKYGRGGKWYGWTVARIGADDIVIGRPTWATTKRSEVIAAVIERI